MEDLLAFLFSYLPILGCWIGAAVIIAIFPIIARKPKREPRRWRTTGFLIIASVFSWTIYFALTAERSWAISMLDSEDDGCAERAYVNTFKISLNDAIRIARNDSYRGNIRFYAAFRAADLLTANGNEQRAAEVLKRVEDAPLIQTDFFGTNGLTCGYFIPGHQEGPFEVADLIRRRMQSLRDRTNTITKL